METIDTCSTGRKFRAKWSPWRKMGLQVKGSLRCRGQDLKGKLRTGQEKLCLWCSFLICRNQKKV